MTGKNAAAVALGKLRMAKLSWLERSELGKLAARAKALKQPVKKKSVAAP